ncbi:MAG: HlyD family efflux transporter periplasmic adaptor subunit [Lachnospiraceae bacterium]|nr:HlyD family efflux transporter periplasmic adaptor subunit [Lachnospiraceae bacterium]
MEKETESKRKQIVKKAAVIFLVVLMILTFFSNTIMNYSLPEVSTEPVSSGSVSNKVRGQGTVETNSDYEVMVSGARVVKEVKIESGQEVKAGDVLFTFEEGENTELEAEQETLDQMELEYAKSLLKNAPDYTSDNMDIASAKEDLEEAINDQKEAASNEKKLKTAKKEASEAKKKVDAQQKKVDSIQEKIDAYGEVGSYDEAQANVTTLSRELDNLKKELSYLREDLAALKRGEELENEPEATVTSKEREISYKEIEVSNKETDLANAKATASALKSTSTTVSQLKENLTKETKALTAMQETLAEKNAKVEELSAKPSAKDAAKTVKEKRKTLEQMLLALKSRKSEDAINEKTDSMNMQADKEKIEKQKAKVEKIKASSDLKEIKAKEDGVVSEVNCKEGDSVTADVPLAKIQLAESGYIVNVTVTKAQAKLVRAGDEATVENIWDDDIEATVKSIKASPDNPNQNMMITFEVKGNVNPGETLALSAGTKSNRYDAVVPNNAIREDSKGKFVLIVTVKGTPLGNRYKVKRADIEVQASDDTSSGVTGGVYEYENVVTTSSKPLENGMQVRLAE